MRNGDLFHNVKWYINPYSLSQLNCNYEVVSREKVPFLMNDKHHVERIYPARAADFFTRRENITVNGEVELIMKGPLNYQ